MAKEITEGLLFDLLTKRRAGHFTGDELLWAADHPDIIRWVKENFYTIKGLSTGRLKLAERAPFPCECICPELIPEKWEIVEDVEPSQFDGKTLKIVSYLSSGDQYVNGETMRKRAEELKANLGLASAKYLWDHQDQIPAGFRGKFLVFAGTLLLDLNGEPRLALLRWDGDCWYLDFTWVDRGVWRDPHCLLRCE